MGRMGASRGVISGSSVPGAKIPRSSSLRTCGSTLPSSEASKPLYLVTATPRELPSFRTHGGPCCQEGVVAWPGDLLVAAGLA
jgi:hypothetical protein